MAPAAPGLVLENLQILPAFESLSDAVLIDLIAVFLTTLQICQTRTGRQTDKRAQRMGQEGR